MIFSERYSDFIDVGHGESKDYLCEEITCDLKKRISEVLFHFDEPAIIRSNRYDNYETYSSAFNLAAEKLNKAIGFPVIQFNRNIFDEVKNQDVFSGIFTPWLFDLIELQYIELSNGEKIEYQSALNNLLHENSVPWVLCDGRMIKIDAKQFECDIRLKALRALHELKDCDSKFQAAYEELIKAYEFLEKGSYAEAISNAEKSYESVLKVICGLQKGGADKLTTEYVNKILNDLPATMSNTGFREKVMMVLPYIRNNSSSDHGAGAIPTHIAKPLAKLALNISAAMNTYLIEQYSITFQATGNLNETAG